MNESPAAESPDAYVQSLVGWPRALVEQLRAAVRTVHRSRRAAALYEDYPVPKGCTSPYLPIWIGYVFGKNARS
jgi:hypothetical protein